MNNTTYEFFIRRAWQCQRFERGANADTWDSLLYRKVNYETSRGTPSEDRLRREFESKFAQIKNYVDNAYNNLLYRVTTINNNDAILNSILDLKNEALTSATPQDLYQVLERSFPVMNDNGL